MAKKKSESPEVELKPEETLHSILEENHEAENTPEPVEEEKPETPKEEPQEPEKIEPPVIDTEKIKEELRAEVSKEVTEKMVTAIQGEKEKKDEYDTFKEDFEQKNGRAPQWKEVAGFLKQQAISEIRAEQEAERKAQEDQQAQIKSSNEDNAKKWNSYWDSQLEELTTTHKIPKVEDPKDKEDKGVKARQELFAAMVELNTERAAAGKPSITDLMNMNVFEKYQANHKQPAGFNAPVAGKVRSGGNQVEATAYTAADRKKSLGQILRESVGLS